MQEYKFLLTKYEVGLTLYGRPLVVKGLRRHGDPISGVDRSNSYMSSGGPWSKVLPCRSKSEKLIHASSHEKKEDSGIVYTATASRESKPALPADR
jgi:hypothetical protein